MYHLVTSESISLYGKYHYKLEKLYALVVSPFLAHMKQNGILAKFQDLHYSNIAMERVQQGIGNN